MRPIRKKGRFSRSQPEPPALSEALRYLQTNRGLTLTSVLEAIETALIRAFQHKYGKDARVVIDMNRDTGEYVIYRRREVVAAVTDARFEVSARDVPRRYEPGDFFDEVVSPQDFGRVAAMAARHAVIERVRDTERDTVFNEYGKRANDLVLGTLVRYEQGTMIIDLSNAEAIIPPFEQVKIEHYRVGDTILAFILDVRRSNRGPQIILSRAVEGLVQRLIEREAPEVADGTVEIMGIVREPGSRSKVAVRSTSPQVDPIGACLGPKSSRVANVSAELRGEKIDLILWSDDIAQYIAHALAPAKVLEVEVFAHAEVAVVTVPTYQYALAIGREGQNVRLAARLVNLRLDIVDEEGAEDARAHYRSTVVETPQTNGAHTDVALDDVDPEILRTLQEFKRERFDMPLN